MSYSPSRSHYRVEVWITHPEEDAEDEIESRLSEFLNDNDLRVQGIVAYRVFEW